MDTKNFVKVPLILVIIVMISFVPLILANTGVLSFDIPTSVDSNNSAGLTVLPSFTSLEMDITTSVQQTHANMRHGSEANMARECSKRPDAQIFFNPTTERKAFVCQIGDIFGVHIIAKDGGEVTAFLKNKMHSFARVLQYMKNSGYNLAQ